MTREQGRWLDGLGLEDWKRRPLKYLYRRTKVLGTGEQQLLSIYRDYGVVPRVGREDNFNKPSEDLSKYQLVAKGDLVVNKMKAWQGSVAVSEYDGVISPAYFVYRPTGGVDSRYAHYLLRSNEYFQYYASISSGVRPNQWDLDPRQFERMEVLLPSLEVQRRIADYLDHETTQIDNFISDLELLVQTLDERQKSLSEQVFAPFLEAAVKGDLRGALAEIDQRAGVANPRDLLSVSISTGVSRWVDQTDDLPRAETLGHYKKVRKGDIVMNRMRAFQGAFGVSKWDGVTSPDYAVLRVSESASAEFLTHLMKSERFIHQILQNLRGIGTHDSGQVRTPRLSGFDLIRIPVSLPDRSEQDRVAHEWESAALEAEALKNDVQRFIELARERRSAVISAAVTGQLDVSRVGVGV